MSVERRPIPLTLRLWQVVGTLDVPVLIVGCLAAVARHRWGAYVLIVNLVVQIGSHFAVAAWAYRDVMTRPWPKVQPLDDWDD